MADYDWSQGCARTHLARVRGLDGDALAKVARDYDWGRYPETVLGWVMAQKSIDLDTALATFFAGAPERFNYLHKRDVPPEFTGACRVLDNICLRINCGFYLAREDRLPGAGARLAKWLAVQKIDRREGSSGRWVLDEAIVAPPPGASPAPPPEATADRAAPAARRPAGWFAQMFRPQEVR
ncbi:hypothetical protein K1T73_12350 [Roseovarius sp. SCSIO 43702]|uniref:hypothetical protein n=1 Tax=Roseovarius sp. SCSIO 43702 TaxID=2823043 RepID=UPI001C72CFE2|nr:hypothetical protein [Roseovarius sp. SCSIO 43702]QYX55860.1 hypothetical protein K1T73_12350 [Roseovarius sp. SCSIO 43702]